VTLNDVPIVRLGLFEPLETQQGPRQQHPTAIVSGVGLN
jgi:hypothetical protein